MEQQETQQDPTKLIYVLHNLIKSGKNPKSGSAEDISAFLADNPESADYADEYESKSQEDLEGDEDFMKFYTQLQPGQEDATFAKKGAKLKMLKQQTKCECGCAIDKKEVGGKIVSSCACGCKTKKHEQGGVIEKLQLGKTLKRIASVAIPASTSMVKYIPYGQKALVAGQRAIGAGQLALGAGESTLPAVMGETGLATYGGGAAATGGLGALAAPFALAAGAAYLAHTAPRKETGKGNIYNPKTGLWEKGTQDIQYGNRAKNYEEQPVSTRMNQARMYGSANDPRVDGKWSEQYKKEHADWNTRTGATAMRQKFLNSQGNQPNLSVNNKWDAATTAADKNYMTEIAKEPIIQDKDATVVSATNRMQPFAKQIGGQ